MQRTNRISFYVEAETISYSRRGFEIDLDGNVKYRFLHAAIPPHRQIIVSGGLVRLPALPADKMCRAIVKNVQMQAPSPINPNYYFGVYGAVDVYLFIEEAKLASKFFRELIDKQNYQQL